MKRRLTVLVAAGAAMITVAAVANQKKPRLLVLDWAARSGAEAPPRAVLIEMGLQDRRPAGWSGRAHVTGARVVHREGYRFRPGDGSDGDRLLEPDAWQASSHRPLRLPRGNPAALERLATVGVVLHLADVRPDASLTVEVKGQEPAEVRVPLRDVLAGRTQRLWDGRAAVRLVSAATPVVTAKTEDDFPAAAYGPDGTLWLAYVSYTVKDEARRIEQPQLKEQPRDFKAFLRPEFGDQLWVKYERGGKWSEPIAVTDGKQDLARCAIAVEGGGTVRIAYSAHRHGRFRMFVRSIAAGGKGAAPRLGPEEEVRNKEEESHPGPWLHPVMATTTDGATQLACRVGLSSVYRVELRDGEQRSVNSYEGTGSTWHPDVAIGPNGGQAVAWDHYADEGDYDVFVQEGERMPLRVAGSSRFEARPSLCYDPLGRLWIAYEEGPEQWGKDFGALDQAGNPLYFGRTVRVVCLHRGKLFRPAAELPPLAGRTGSPDTGVKVEAMPRYSNPCLGLDGKGRLWLAYRQKFGTRHTSHPGSHWLSFARRLDGDHWTEPIEVHHSDGLLDSRPVLLPHPAGGLRILHNTDGRYTTPHRIDNQIYHSTVDLPGDPVEPKLVPHDPGRKDERLARQARAERDSVRRMRGYRVEAGGKSYRLLRGEFHRHTEVSWDGGPDGSLEDMFRYGIDAAAMDWIGNGDHDNGAGREYPWWLTQKLTDLYHVPGRFTPVFSYERSVAYPHGHRNCVFARRGVATLPRLAPPSRGQAVGGVHADDTKMLYRYLKELDGICASHTSATGMGTDWRDNDPAVEPVVEIYQGDRMSYEKEEAPRAGYNPKSGKKPVNIGGWYPKGFINLALERGYRLGFQSSSDHFSTHISFCIILAEGHDRAAIVDGLKKRHCYAATDNFIVDVRSGDHVMGDEFRTSEAPALQLVVHGTDKLARIDILKDSAVVKSLEPGTADYRGSWTDPKPTDGVHYYYVRVLQANDEIAWSSPLWVNYTK